MDMRVSVLSSVLICVLILYLFDVYEATLLLKDVIARPKFEYFKKKYHETYKSEADENQAYLNFVNNWNELDKLNERSIAVYTINSYADMSPVYMNEHYAVNVTPFDIETGESQQARALRESKQKADNMVLYDLDNAEELYKNFLRKFRKKKEEKNIHNLKLLKFVQTLAKINRHNLLYNDNQKYDRHADEIKEPEKFKFS